MSTVKRMSALAATRSSSATISAAGRPSRARSAARRACIPRPRLAERLSTTVTRPPKSCAASRALPTVPESCPLMWTLITSSAP